MSNARREKRRATMRYAAIYTPVEEGGYVVTFPMLPGLVTEGNTLAGARRMAAEAVAGYVESLLRDGLPIPKDATRVEAVEVHVAMPATIAAARRNAKISDEDMEDIRDARRAKAEAKRKGTVTWELLKSELGL